MVNKCCMPECRSNYRGTQFVKVFQFPSLEKHPELHKKWLKAVSRKDDWVPTKHTVVCINHFHPSDIDNTGARTRLKENAVPQIHADKVPEYMNKPAPVVRTDPNRRRETYVNNYNHQVDEWMKSDCITDFASFKEKVAKDYKDRSPWYVKIMDNYIIFCIVDDTPMITSSVKVDNQLNCEIRVNNLILSRFDYH